MRYLAIDGAGIEEDVQKCGVGEVPQPADTGKSQRLQATERKIQKTSLHCTERNPHIQVGTYMYEDRIS